MDGMYSMFDNAGSMGHFDINVMMKMNSIDRSVQQHLSRVYMLLAVNLICSIAGVMVYLKTGIEMGFFGLIGMMGLIMYIQSTRSSDVKMNKNRLGALLIFGFTQGITLGSLVEIILQVDPSILLLAFLSTTTVFLCFSASALLAPRRSYLYLGGILSSCISFFMLLNFMQIFMGYSNLIMNIHLYGGLLVFMGYVIFDTQVILEQAIMKTDRDAIWHSLQLFIDFIAIFVRIAIILLKNSNSNKDDKKKRNGRTSNR